MRRDLTYEQVTSELGFTLCVGCSAHDHEAGYANPSRGILHWTPRRMTRRGLRQFLKLAAAIFLSHNRGQPEWQRLYEQNVWAYREARRRFSVVFPREWSRSDRARTLFLIHGRHFATDHPAVYKWAKEAIG